MMQAIKRLLEGRFVVYATIAYTILLTFLFLVPTTDVPTVEIPFIDKLIHVVLFCFLALGWILTSRLRQAQPTGSVRSMLLLVFIYGIIIEALQELFFETRTADGWDIAANSVGILIGWWLFLKLKQWMRLKS
ncbi:MAG: VanZ family protein [Flavobacteriaceae bacterium]|nr:VanZ family protein [Flavobacteriaceae bacterium]